MTTKKPKQHPPQVLQFRVALEDVTPEIWRRIQVPSSYTFWDLHVAIQDAMGWEDTHLHEFQITHPKSGKDERIGIPDLESGDDEETLPGWEVDVASFFTAPKARAEYLYDFSDGWQHSLELEALLPGESGVRYPRITAGERACPPEDSGGPDNYEELVAALQDPEHEDYETFIELVGPDFDPEAFEMEDVVFEDPQSRWELAFGDDAAATSDAEFDSALSDPDPKVLNATFREVIEKQLHDGEPPETKATYDRLITEGHSKEEVLQMLCAVVASEMFEIVRTKRPHDPEQYARWLNNLPKLPFD